MHMQAFRKEMGYFILYYAIGNTRYSPENAFEQ